MSLNRLKLSVPEMGLSSLIVGITHMSSLACCLLILNSSFAFPSHPCNCAFVFKYSQKGLISPAGLQAHWGQTPSSPSSQFYVLFCTQQSGDSVNASWIYFAYSTIDIAIWHNNRYWRKEREEMTRNHFVVSFSEMILYHHVLIKVLSFHSYLNYPYFNREWKSYVYI